ncbi:MAG: ABC transporter substrate-binding protein [Lachnospiraceae bacterium]
MKKLLSLMSVLLAFLMLLSACGAPAAETSEPPAEDTGSEAPPAEESPAEAEPVTITYCNFNASGGNEETLAKMYEAFHEEYPNITVEIETIGFDDYFTQMQTRVAGGTAPDCYELNIENFASYAAKGALAEITGVDLSGLDETALSAFNVGGKQYGLPGNFSNVVLVYNKDLFDQAGVAYPTADRTQDDLQAAAEAIRALGDDIFGIYQPITYNEFYKVAAQYGGSLLNEDLTEFTINSPENVQAAQVMVDRVLVSNVQPTEVQMGGMGDWDLFMSGHSA